MDESWDVLEGLRGSGCLYTSVRVVFAHSSLCLSSSSSSSSFPVLFQMLSESGKPSSRFDVRFLHYSQVKI